jgi:6-phosphogluconolactonase
MFDPSIKIFSSAEELCQAAAGLLVELSAAAAPSRLSVALSGGSTPKRLYNIMRDNHAEAAMTGFEYFFGDVRLVPDSSVDSNFSMAFASLLSIVDPRFVHPVPIPHGISSPPTAEQQPLLDAAVAQFEAELRGSITTRSSDGVPVFDAILLGLGPDGHTASLFPGTAASLETERLAAACMPAPGVSPYVPRITITQRIIQAAKLVVVLATGADKAWVVRGILSSESSPEGEGQPVARLLRNCSGQVFMFLDEAIAAGISRKA